jgi:hypothetical protein
VFGGSLESGGRIYGDVFGGNMASVIMKMFTHFI